MCTLTKTSTSPYFAVQCMLACAVAVATFLLFTIITLNLLAAAFTAALAFIFTLAIFSSPSRRNSYLVTSFFERRNQERNIHTTEANTHHHPSAEANTHHHPSAGANIYHHPSTHHHSR